MADFPINVTFRNLDVSEAVKQRVEDEAAKLARYYGHIMSADIVVEAPQARRRHGDLYAVAVHLTVPPGQRIDVTHAGRKNHAHEDVYVAIEDSFKAARRQLQDHARRQDHRTRPHAPPTHGKVLRVDAERGFGFIEVSDGREIYFHRNSVVGADFDKLEEGAEVRIEIAEGESPEGPQASTVIPVGKHHIVG